MKIFFCFSLLLATCTAQHEPTELQVEVGELGELWAFEISGSGEKIIIGDTYSNGKTGEAFLYEFDGNTYTKTYTFDGNVKGDWFGVASAISDDGKIIAISSISGGNNVEYESGEGDVKIYNTDDLTTPIQTLTGLHIDSRFGVDVELSGDGKTIAIGASWYDVDHPDVDNDYGQVTVFRYDDSTQKYEQIDQPINFIISKPNADSFGLYIDLSNDGNTFVSSFDNDREIKVFFINNNQFEEKTIDLGEVLGSAARVAISNNGNFLIVGDHRYDSEKGRVLIYKYENNEYALKTTLLGDEFLDQCGREVDINYDATMFVISCTLPTGKGALRAYTYDTSQFIEEKFLEKTGSVDYAYFSYLLHLSADGTHIATVNEPETITNPNISPLQRVTVYKDLLPPTAAPTTAAPTTEPPTDSPTDPPTDSPTTGSPTTSSNTTSEIWLIVFGVFAGLSLIVGLLALTSLPNIGFYTIILLHFTLISLFLYLDEHVSGFFIGAIIISVNLLVFVSFGIWYLVNPAGGSNMFNVLGESFTLNFFQPLMQCFKSETPKTSSIECKYKPVNQKISLSTIHIK